MLLMSGKRRALNVVDKKLHLRRREKRMLRMRRWIMVLGAVVVLVVAACSGSVEPVPTTAESTTTTEQTTTTTEAPEAWVDFYDLRVGDCSKNEEFHRSGDESLWLQLSCNEVHDIEVYALLEYPVLADAPYPGGSVLNAWTVDACEKAFVEYVGVDSVTSVYSASGSHPEPALWKSGERTTVCLLYEVSRGVLRTQFSSARDSKK